VTGNIQSPSENASHGAMKEPEVDPKNIIKSREQLYRLMIRFIIILFASCFSHNFILLKTNFAETINFIIFLFKVQFLCVLIFAMSVL